MKYEYKIFQSGMNPNAEENALNELGSDGWELVSTVGDPDNVVLLYLKRPLS